MNLIEEQQIVDGKTRVLGNKYLSDYKISTFSKNGVENQPLLFETTSDTYQTVTDDDGEPMTIEIELTTPAIVLQYAEGMAQGDLIAFPVPSYNIRVTTDDVEVGRVASNDPILAGFFISPASRWSIYYPQVLQPGTHTFSLQLRSTINGSVVQIARARFSIIVFGLV